MTLTGLTALSVDIPTTVSTSLWLLLMARTMFSAPDDVGLYRFERKVLAGRHLLERGRVEHHVDTLERGRDRVHISHIPDLKFERAGKIPIDDLVGWRAFVLIGHSQLVLLGLIA